MRTTTTPKPHSLKDAPDPETIHLYDISRFMAATPLFGGMTDPTQGPYTLAWHALLCDRIAGRLSLAIKDRAGLMLHRSAGYAIGHLPDETADLVPGYPELRDLWKSAINTRFGLRVVDDTAIRRCDAIAMSVAASALSVAPIVRLEKSAAPLPGAADWFELWSHHDRSGSAFRTGQSLFVRRVSELI
jgi:hypothetical protein